jgi:hypothetical protein
MPTESSLNITADLPGLDSEETAPPPAVGPGTASAPPVKESPRPHRSPDLDPAAAGSDDRANELARLIAESRRLGSRRFAELEPFRDVLLTERRAGASIRLLTKSLAKLGVNVSEETLRVWLLRHKMPKRRKPRKQSAARNLSLLPPARAVMPVAASAPTGPRRSPRIARDVY